MTHLGSLAVVSLACGVAWGCHDARSVAPSAPSFAITGSGRVVTESRPASGFSAVSVSLPARVVFVQSDVDSLSVTAEDNILPLVRTEVVGGRLVLGLTAASLSTTRGIVIEVSARHLTAIQADGATHLELTGVQEDAFSLQVSGASHVTAAGRVRELRLEVSGTVRCEMDGLASRTAVANVSGTSYARFRVADSLAATASGLSTVEYYGDPVVVANVSGGSAVRRVGS